jgi:SAM-dependent methyltransferase
MNVKTQKDRLHAFSLLPAFNAVIEPNVRRRVQKRDFAFFHSFGLDDTARRLLQAAADDLPNCAQSSLRTFFDNVAPTEAGTRQTIDFRAIVDNENNLDVVRQLGDDLRSSGYANSVTMGPLARFALGYPVASVEVALNLPKGLAKDLLAVGLAARSNGNDQLQFGVLSIDGVLAAIPREGSSTESVYVGPDSVLLLEAALRLAPSGDRAADLGTGTGLSAAVLACRYKNVIATDISWPAAAAASITFALNRFPVAHTCTPIVTDVIAGLRKSSFDLVIANPPWVPSGAAEEKLYADGGPTGFELPGRFIWEGAQLLRPSGIAIILATDPELDDGSKPLLDMCDRLSRADYVATIIPLTPVPWRPTGQDTRIIGNRLVTLIIERRATDEADASWALAAAKGFLWRRWARL